MTLLDAEPGTRHRTFRWKGIALILAVVSGLGPEGFSEEFSLRVTVTSQLELPNVPVNPQLDFGDLLRGENIAGRLDRDSVRVINFVTGKQIPHALSPHFQHGDSGEVRWVIEEPEHRDYMIRFSTSAERRPATPPAYVPPIGIGDLLRYNAGQPRPIVLPNLCRLIDLTGDGKRDLIGCWSYAYEAGQPWSGVFCYPRVGDPDTSFEFGDPIRLRYVEETGSTEYRHFNRKYMHADLADLNGDGRIDLVFSGSGGKQLQLYLNSGDLDTGNMPVFVASGSVNRGTAKYGPVRAIDLDRDGTMDFVCENVWQRGQEVGSWPPVLAEPVKLDAGSDPCFLDLDGDGRPDAISLAPGPGKETRAHRISWRKNLGMDDSGIPRFGPSHSLAGINPEWCQWLAAVPEGKNKGILVSHNARQSVSFFEWSGTKDGAPQFREFGLAQSLSQVLSMTDQSWPFFCDWDNDGDLDFLMGGGFGWPRISINRGSRTQPAFDPPQRIFAQGKPLRVLRSEILGARHWHDMGYPLPSFIDWDGDGRKDLMLPNETNRIFWHQNIGSKMKPDFGEQQQILVEGFPDSIEMRAESAKLSGDRTVPNHPYPHEKSRPFFWRVTAGFADLNGDGHMDIITHDGHKRKLTFFAQFPDQTGKFVLRRMGPLKLTDGRLIDDAIVGRKAHWTESFRCLDWNRDGLIDVMYSLAGHNNGKGSIFFLKNVGTKKQPVFALPEPVHCFGKPIFVTEHGPNPWFGDYDGDGNPDIVTCVEFSVYPYFSHAALTMKQAPEYKFGPLELEK